MLGKRKKGYVTNNKFIVNTDNVWTLTLVGYSGRNSGLSDFFHGITIIITVIDSDCKLAWLALKFLVLNTA